jgi:hypothetical protein
MMTSTPPLDVVIKTSVSWLQAAGLELQHVDRLQLLDGQSKALAHRGFALDIPATVATAGRNRRGGLVTDTVVVELLYRVRPAEQELSRSEAVALEQKVIARMTAGAPDFYRVAYLGTPRRGPHSKSAEYYHIRLNFSLQVRQVAYSEEVV